MNHNLNPFEFLRPSEGNFPEKSKFRKMVLIKNDGHIGFISDKKKVEAAVIIYF